MTILKKSIIYILLLLPLTAIADRGADLYAENCSICHGLDGNGGVGVPLALPSFLSQVSDSYLHRSIRVGRPGRVMPPFYKLSDAEIDDIVKHLRSWSDAPAPPRDERPVIGIAARGEKLYQTKCANCHGQDLTGGVGTGLMFSRSRDLPITAPALSNQGFLNSATDQMIKKIIINGREETPMPSAKLMKITETDVDDIVAYIRSFQLPMVSRAPSLDDEPATIIYDSPYDFAETVENLKRAIIGSNYLLIRDQALDAGLVSQENESKSELIVYFCNFNLVYEALKIDPRVGMFLPCRITVVERDGKVQMMSINPKHLSRLFNNNELNEACDHMYEVYTSILDGASL
ncbi:MAG: c-type cytochrome [Gammaproteobacteria bacterium]|nr:c-type cytochrome [Gammaproteobacteria bacterium]